MHYLIYEKAETEIAGKYKTRQNFISGSNYTTVSPEYVNEEMKKLEEWIEENYENLHPIVLLLKQKQKQIT